jgi:hypothetical protein
LPGENKAKTFSFHNIGTEDFERKEEKFIGLHEGTKKRYAGRL